jgi:hypothetical protein
MANQIVCHSRYKILGFGIGSLVRMTINFFRIREGTEVTRRFYETLERIARRRDLVAVERRFVRRRKDHVSALRFPSDTKARWGSENCKDVLFV